MSLKRQFAAGAMWAVIGNGANNLISLIVFAIIAHAVPPAVLGVVAFAMVMIDLGKTIATVGVPDLLVQRPTWDNAFANLGFYVNIAAAVLLTLLAVFVIAPFIDVRFAAGSGIALTALSSCYFIDAIRTVHESKIRREFQYKKLAARGTASGILSGLVGVTLALLLPQDQKIWALISQRIAASVFTTLFTWYASDWRPGFRMKTDELGWVLVNGNRLVLTALLSNLVGRIPDLVLGSLSGPVAVAIYRVGSRGYEALFQLTILPLITASLGGFSRVADPATISHSYLRVTKFLALIAYPLFFGSAAVARLLVPIVFGPQWDVSSRVMTALCLMVGPMVLSFMMYPALTAMARMRETVWISSGGLLSAAVFCFVAAPYGAEAVAFALLLRANAAAIFNVYLLHRLLGVDPWRLLATIAPAYLSAVVMAGSVSLAHDFLFPDVADWIMIIAMVAAGGVIYPALLWIFARDYSRSALTEMGDMFPPLQKITRRFDRNPDRRELRLDATRGKIVL